MELATLHRNLARELQRLHLETIAMQAAIGPDLSNTNLEGKGLLGLQALDAHAQILADLARITLALCDGGASGQIDVDRLLNVKMLPSTAQAIFQTPESSASMGRSLGDVTLF